MNYRPELVTLMQKCMIFTFSGEKVDSSLFSDGDDVPLSSLSIDSLAAMQFCIELEAHFGWSVTPEELLAFETVGDIARALDAHVSR